MSRHCNWIALFCACACALTGSQLFAITVVNNSFEDPGFVTGWNVMSGGDMVLVAGSTPYGNQHLEIGGFGGGVQNSIDQIVGGFTPGNFYEVTFSTASQWAGSTGAQVEVSFLSGSSTGAQVFTAPPVASWGSWNTHTYGFTATASSVDIQFKQITNGFDDVGLDNVLITEVPEPTSMLLGSLGLVGVVYSALRRKSAATTCTG